MCELGCYFDGFGAEEIKAIDEEVQAALVSAHESIEFRPPGPDEPYEPRGPWQGYQRERPLESPLERPWTCPKPCK